MVLFLQKKKYYRDLAWAGFAFLGLMVGVAPFAIAGMPAQNRWLGASLFLAFMGCIFGVGPLLLLLDYRRSRLAIDGDRLAWQGLWRRGLLQLSAVEQLTWRWVKNYRIIVLQAPDQRLKISLDDYERETWLPLIRHLRNSIPEDRQRDWDWFCVKTALPLRGAENALAHQPSDAGEAALAADFTITRRRWDGFFLVTGVILAPVVIAWWWMMNDPRVFTIYPALVPLWLYLRITTPARGIRTKRWSRDAPERRFLGWSVLLMMPLSALCKLAQRHPVAWAVYLTVFIGWAVLTIWFMVRQERRRNARDAAAVESAPLEWDLGESNSQPRIAAS
jgi:hypothetical protein